MPLRVLVLGGTQFVGRWIVETLVQGGHSVTVLNRGVTHDELPREVERLRGDRDQGSAGIAALQGGSWDACVDVSGYTPRQVRPAVEQLTNRVGRYVLMSAVSVYGNPPRGPVTETEPRMTPAPEDVTEVVGEMYGRLKVTCENIVAEAFGARAALLRPQIVAGPHDPFDRFSYWVRRADQPGEMLAPGDGTDFLQYIDCGDVARFAMTVCERGLAGAFNLAGPRIQWAEFLQRLGARNLVWIPHEQLAHAGLTEFELPLYRRTGGWRSSLMHVDQTRAIAAGLTLTPTAETIRQVREWLPNSGLNPALSPEREAAIIAAYRHHPGVT